MDAERFERWARSLATTRSRRAVIAALATAALDLLGGHAAATCPGLGVFGSCNNDGDCADCDDAVCQGDRCLRPTGGKCRKNAQCASGRCSRKKHKCRPCPKGVTACDGFCSFDCHNMNPNNCSCCELSDPCVGGEFCCAGECSGGGGSCDCAAAGATCTFNTECCTTDLQCCSRHCGADGRCAAPCGNGEPTCNGVCCASGTHCAADGTCACNRPLCQGVCCPTGTSCTPAGLCVSDPTS